MLSEEEKQEIEAEFPHYANKQSVCIDALKIVQRHRGWVSDEAVKDVAALLDMRAKLSDAELDRLSQIIADARKEGR